jgi:hypothetical protein
LQTLKEEVLHNKNLQKNQYKKFAGTSEKNILTGIAL